MGKYYDGTKLLSMLDLHNRKPEIYMVTSNRTGGKTTYFGKLVTKRFLNSGSKFALLYRYDYELSGVAEKFFKDIQTLFFPDYEMTSKPMMHGKFHELFLNNVSCGYAIALNNADAVKKNSHMFSDVDSIIFDEFQSETNKYAQNEVKKFISIHTSISRGQGKQVRYVPVYMMSNPVSILNPYYTALGISNRLKDYTKFLRGNGFVLEQGYNESASKAQAESGFNMAFANDSYVAYSGQATYLNDSAETPISPELMPADSKGEIKQRTEDLIGPYELHDFFIYNFIRYGYSPVKIFNLACRAFGAMENGVGCGKNARLHQDVTFDKATILKWLKKFYWRFFSQQFKRSCMPDGPKISLVSFSPRGDWRMPSDAQVQLWISELEKINV